MKFQLFSMSRWVARSGAAALVVTLAAVLAAQSSGSAEKPDALGMSGNRVIIPVLSGDLRTHDPALIRAQGSQDRAWYVFSTGDPSVSGGAIQIRRSTDGRRFDFLGTVFSQTPEWVRTAVPGITNMWAPDVTYNNGIYYLYYSGSTFGSNRSVIGLATNTTLDPTNPAYSWVDQGMVFSSAPTDDFNAIDPNVSRSADGTPYLAFGSFWSGIRMIQVTWSEGKPASGQGEPLRLADRRVPPNAVEAPHIISRGGWYYMFISFDFCCRGADSTYKIAVGRSRSITGPYYDRLGTPLAHGGGTVILSENGSMIGPGGQSVFDGWLAYHYYDTNAGGDFRLGVRRIAWGTDGWPKVTA